MIRQSPKYTVTTLALVIITVAAFGLKFASQYLPERRPNELAKEYGEYLRRSMRQNVQWFALKEAPFEQALASDKTVLLEIGSTMSLSAKLFSEDYATDGEYRQLFHDHFEAIKVDALELPWVVDALSLNVGPIVRRDRFMIFAMTPNGQVFQSTGLIPKDGDRSLANWLTRIARLRYSNQGEIGSSGAYSIAESRRMATAQLEQGAATVDDVEAWSRNWEHAGTSGALATLDIPIATFPMETLLASPVSDAWGAGLAMMLALAYSPSSDLLDGGFFVTAYDKGWQRPVTAKLVGHTLLMAAGYAEASQRFDLPLFRQIARRAADWAVGLRRDGLFPTGVGTDQTSDGRSPYYSLEDRDVHGNRFGMDDRGIPFVKDVTSFAQAVSEQQSRELFKDAEELAKRRKARKLPRADSTTYADINGQAVAGLLRVGMALDDAELVEIGLDSFKATRNKFVQPLGDVVHAPLSVHGRIGYCADYAWFTRAALEAYRATGDLEILDAARNTTGRAMELFQDDSGALMMYLPSLLTLIGFDFPVFSASDTEVLGVNALWVINLSDLAAITGESNYQSTASSILRAFAGGFGETLAPAGFVLAGRRLYGDYILYREVQDPRLVGAISFPAPPGRIGQGAFKVRETKITGRL